MKRVYTQKEIQADNEMLQGVFAGKIIPSASRFLTKSENEQRGCRICEYSQSASKLKMDDVPDTTEKNERILICRFDHCPLHEMDQYKSYGEYCRVNRLKLDKLMGKIFGDQIRKELEKQKKENAKTGKKKSKKKEPYIPKFIQLTDHQKWTIGVRDSQGYSSQVIAAELGITEVQARKEALVYRLKNR